jgi:hypothetical protein
MRLKTPKKPGNRRMSNLVDPTDVLVCARVSKALPRERLVDAACRLFKYAFIENGRLLAFSDGQDYVLVANLLDESSAGRLRANLLQNPADLKLCDTPGDAARRVKPWGQVLPGHIEDVVGTRLAQDPDVVNAIRQGQAERMDGDPDGDYVFPNLSAGEYEAVKAERTKKPQ